MNDHNKDRPVLISVYGGLIYIHAIYSQINAIILNPSEAMYRLISITYKSYKEILKQKEQISMIYAIGHREVSQTEGQEFIIDKEIPRAEYDNINKELAEASKLNAMKSVYLLFERNGKEFLTYSNSLKKLLNEPEQNEDPEKIFLEANRLLINYLSALSMFIDYGERFNKKHFGKKKLEEFGDKTHDFYDNHISYRFIALMRNYALHYGFPLSKVSTSLLTGQSGIFATKVELLKFSGWKHVRRDIEEMPEVISVDVHVEISMMFIKHLYDSYIYDIAPTVIKGVEYFESLLETERS